MCEVKLRFALQLRLFHLQNDEIEEVELAGFDFQHQTLFCANVIADQYLQVDLRYWFIVHARMFDILDHYTFGTSNWK